MDNQFQSDMEKNIRQNFFWEALVKKVGVELDEPFRIIVDDKGTTILTRYYRDATSHQITMASWVDDKRPVNKEYTLKEFTDLECGKID